MMFNISTHTYRHTKLFGAQVTLVQVLSESFKLTECIGGWKDIDTVHARKPACTHTHTQ